MTIEQLRESNWIIFEGIVGSHAYGLNTPTSDIDHKGVFIQPLESILGMGYIEQISDEKNDTTFYEIKRYLELVTTNNPNILELLNLPEDMTIYKHPVYNLVLEHRNIFLTKTCKNSFAGYAVSQIRKARGLNKKIVNPVDKIRKTPLHFTYVPMGVGGSQPFLEWFSDYLSKNDLFRFLTFRPYSIEEASEMTKYIGLSVVPNARDLYHVFFNKKKTYRGMINEDLSSNELRLTSIPKGQTPICVISANMDGYTKYCKDYKEYWEWFEKRNQARYNDNAQHGKGYDSKNMMHCHRLLDMAIEIAQGKGIIVRRPDREYLLNIRTGEMNYEELMAIADEKIKLSDELYDNNTTLPDSVDPNFTHELLVKIRKSYYKIPITVSELTSI